MAAGCDASVSDLKDAVSSGNVSLVKTLLDAGADVNSMFRNEDESPLFNITFHNDPDYREKNVTILCMAVKSGNVDVVKELINHGADVDLKCKPYGLSPLHVAAKEGDGGLAVLAELIVAGADVNILLPRLKYAPIHLAAENGHTTVLRKLIEVGAKLNLQNRKRQAPIHLACENGHAESVVELVKAGANLEILDRLGETPIHTAARNGDIETIGALIKACIEVNVRNRRKVTPIHLATRYGHTGAVVELIKAEADVNALNDNNEAPVHIAAEESCMDILAKLIDAAADVNVLNEDGEAPIDIAIEKSHTDIVVQLIKAGAQVKVTNEVRVAAENCDIDGLVQQIQACTELKVLNDIVKEALIHLAAGNGTRNNFGLVELIKAGGRIDPWVRQQILEGDTYSSLMKLIMPKLYDDREYASALDDLVYALLNAISESEERESRKNDTQNDNIQEVNFSKFRPQPGSSSGTFELERPEKTGSETDYNLDALTIPDHHGRSLLRSLVCLGWNKQTIKEAKAKGISVGSTDCCGRTILFDAICIGNEKAVYDSVDAGCPLETVDKKKRSVLHLAAAFGHCDLMEFFISKGLDPNAVDENGRNSVHFAAMCRQDEAVKLLKTHGADCQKRDERGLMPYDYLHDSERDGLTARRLLGGKTKQISYVHLDEDNFEYNRTNPINMAEISVTPGLGSVECLENFKLDEMVLNIKEKIRAILLEAVPELEQEMGATLVGVGSSNEKTKLGIPDEVDFLISLPIGLGGGLREENEGYMFMSDYNMHGIEGSFSVWLWNKLLTWWYQRQNSNENSGEKFQIPFPPVRHPEHMVCVNWIWLYSDDIFKVIPISIDLVMAFCSDIHHSTIQADTWAKTREELEEMKSYIVPKVPKAVEEGRSLGRVSYPAHEVQHMLKLDPRIKGVYITAKAMRMQEICGFKIKDGEGNLHMVGAFVTSYRLKTVFLHLVPVFLRLQLSVGRMVLLVYEQLESCLVSKELPMFFRPDINVLAGSGVDLTVSTKVAKVMSKYVKKVYEEDFKADIADDDRQLAEVALQIPAYPPYGGMPIEENKRPDEWEWLKYSIYMGKR